MGTTGGWDSDRRCFTSARNRSAIEWRMMPSPVGSVVPGCQFRYWASLGCDWIASQSRSPYESELSSPSSAGSGALRLSILQMLCPCTTRTSSSWARSCSSSSSARSKSPACFSRSVRPCPEARAISVFR